MNQEHLMKFTIRKMEQNQMSKSKSKSKKRQQHSFIWNFFKKVRHLES